MPTLEALLKKYGDTPMDSRGSGPRAKLLSQAKRMLHGLQKKKNITSNLLL